MIVLAVVLATLLVAGGVLVFVHRSNRVEEKEGVTMQIKLPQDDDTSADKIVHVLKLLHGLGGRYSLEFVRTHRSFLVLLWICSEGFESPEEAFARAKRCMVAAFPDAVCEPFDDEGELEDVEGLCLRYVLAKPYWYSLKPLEQFKGIETLDTLAEMIEGRLQIVAEPMFGWRNKLERHLMVTGAGTKHTGLLSDLAWGFGRSFIRDPRRIDKEMSVGGIKLTPLEKANVETGWTSLEHPAFHCEVRLTVASAAALGAAETGLRIFALEHGNYLTRGKDDPKLAEYVAARDFVDKRAPERRRMILPANVLGALWHPAGAHVNSRDVDYASARVLPMPPYVHRLEGVKVD